LIRITTSARIGFVAKRVAVIGLGASIGVFCPEDDSPRLMSFTKAAGQCLLQKAIGLKSVQRRVARMAKRAQHIEARFLEPEARRIRF